MDAVDLTKCLAQLDEQYVRPVGDEEEAEFQSGLPTRCQALYEKPLREYSPGDLRVMIGQNTALEYLVPLALNELSHDPMVAGDYYPGDLLTAVLQCGNKWYSARFWQENPPLRSRLTEILQRPRNDPEVRELTAMFWISRGFNVAPPDKPQERQDKVKGRGKRRS